jgi:hypothetical protein
MVGSTARKESPAEAGQGNAAARVSARRVGEIAHTHKQEQACEQRKAIWRDRMWADAMLAQRDPMAPLQ